MTDFAGLLHASVSRTFGERVNYTPAGGPAITLTDAIFREPTATVEVPDGPPMLTVRPSLGVRLAAMPAGWDPEAAQGESFTVASTGKTYTVAQGRPNGAGWAYLEAVHS